ncbi:MAG TPA: lipopolysaccharide biosynthesis protein [Anaeromyxobacteraceae bacterium]|nr:lipopolysaccharide biosynthesis protein [Anaeromyxobacteraceae bacterium]
MERTYTVQDLGAALRRRRMLALIVGATVLVVGLATIFALPDEYLSESVVQVEPHRLAPDFFPAQQVTPFEDRMRTLKHGILARPVLERVIRETDFFPDVRDDLDEAVNRMRRSVEVRLEGEVVGGPPSLLFVVAVRGRDREKVAKAAELLPKYYAEMTRGVLESQAKGLRTTLDAQVSELSKALGEHEQKIIGFKAKHATELPEALETNLRAVGRAQALIEFRMGLLADAQRRRQDALAALPEGPSETVMAQEALEAARRRLAGLESWYAPDHPDVKRTRREVQELQARRDAELSRYQKERFEPRLGRIDAEIAEHRSAVEDLRSELATHHKRVEAAPRWGAELAALSRDYETLRSKYVTTVARRADAAAAESLLAVDAPNLFRVLQPAAVPTTPVSPDRGRLAWIALAFALGAALAVAAIAEWLDGSVRAPEDATAFNVPVLATIPRIGPRGRVQAS